MNFVNNDNFNRTNTVNIYMPIPLVLIAFSNGVNLEIFSFGTFASIICIGVLVFTSFLSGGGRILDL